MSGRHSFLNVSGHVCIFRKSAAESRSSLTNQAKRSHDFADKIVKVGPVDQIDVVIAALGME